jgi:S1-C subfamily serine protease
MTQHRTLTSRPRRVAVMAAYLSGCLAVCLPTLAAPMTRQAPPAGSASFFDVIEQVQPKIAKIYGSGGLRGLEAYQSGFLISAEGHILTVWSYVLDAEEYILVVLHDGTRYPAKILNYDPRLEIALLKIEAQELPHFSLDKGVELSPGARVLALSNLFGIAVGDEPASVLQGFVAAISPLAARRGAYQTVYRGPVYVLDAMTNNPGAAGGALTDRRGHLAGILGKELVNALDNTWLNYAIPISELTASVQDMLAGRNPPRRIDESARRPANPHSLDALGIRLVPDVLSRTPAFIDQLQPGSPADLAGLRPDDLILFVNDRMVSSCKELREELAYVDRIDPLRLTVQRGQELLEVPLQSAGRF